MNVLTISGNLGKAAEKRCIANGNTLLSFSIPMKSGYGDREQTHWVACTLWGKRAEGTLGEHLHKGTFCVVSGECGMKTYTRKDGTDCSQITINVREISFTNPKSHADHQAPLPGGGTINEQVELDDEIPFISWCDINNKQTF